MAVNATAPAGTTMADLPLEYLSLYHTVDPYLSSILVFYGPVATANATVSSSRIQAHIFTPAGFQSYSRITISPAAPLYAAVNHLPREKQGDPVARALAVSMLKYFAELSDPLRKRLTDPARTGQREKIPKLFDEMHAAELANRMVKVEDSSDIVRDIRSAYQERRAPWVDMDVVLPVGTIQPPRRRDSAGSDIEATQTIQYGPYTPLIQALGDPMFLPTSRLKRAPSQPTNVSKSRIFTRNQKEALRLTMCEFVDTEERYVAKVYSLVHEVADEFRQKAQRKGPTSASPDEKALEALFPPCLNEILEVNLGFLDVIRHVLEETERDALEDISQDTELPASGSHRGSSRDARDAIGATVFARALLDWLPQFSQPYADYMRAHTGFTQTLNSFMKDKASSFSRRVYETGEQRLRSLLMEPVQRLPRYSLLIDTMTSNLPLVHPAVRPLLKARDVVKDICALDNASPSGHAQSLRRLRALVDGWPAKTFPEGRLITAVDVNEIPPPYQLDAQASGSAAGIMLLYKNCLVLLVKATESRITARGLLADIDNAASSTNDATTSLPPGELKVVQVLELHAVRCTQSTCGRILFIVPATLPLGSGPADGSNDILALELTAMYEAKVSRLIEETTKARIEGRFSEQEREGGKWTLRSPPAAPNTAGILACVCEEGESFALNQAQASSIRVVFDTPKTKCTEIMNGSNLDVLLSITSNGDQFRLEIDSVIGSPSTDFVSAETFVPTLSKRLQSLLSPLNSTKNPKLVKPLVHSNFEILRYIAGGLITTVKSSRSFRPPSPTKLISNLLGGSRENVPTIKHPSSATLLGEFPKMPPPRANLSRSNTLPSTFPGKDKEKEKEKEKEESPSKISVVGASGAHGLDGQLGSLEQTFAAYVLSLQSRSGNILGRMLRARDHADRAPVNELYNILLEDPSKLQAAAEVPVDTLFVAFETFMKNAWKESMGPVLDPHALKLLQNQFDTMFPLHFEENFRKFLVEISPQNRRALAAIIRLLAELLDASGNDGDRGALTVAFAEVITEEGDPVQHVSLLDRLVDDFDNLFEEFIPGGASVEGTLSCDQTKTSHANTGSVSSNSSSFRKRFGFSLHKESAKAEGESKVASILRTLSKRQSPGDSEPNTPKGSLLRSKSTDVDARLGFLRPTSRDRPYGFASEEQISRPGTGHGQPPSLSSIRGISHDGVVKIRRKRRSSLSDLRPDTASSDASHISATPYLRPVTPSNRPRAEVTTPTSQSRPQSSYLASPSRGTSPAKGTSPGRLGSPIRQTSPTRPSTPSRKENIDPRVPQTERSTKSKSHIPDSPTQEAKRRSRATSIPQRTPGLRERAPVNGPEIKRPQSSSSSQKPQKLRMQSPQKLRERVQTEKKTQATNQLGFRDELRALGDELNNLRLTAPNKPYVESSMGSSEARQSSGAALSLESRLKSLEERFDNMSGEYNGRMSALEKDLESSLIVSEKRVRKLDELYREASAENEALYDRFNTELSKIARDVRSGSAEETMKSQLANALEEISRLKKENFRLKREVGGLRAQSAAVALLRASEQ
ncbi:uncharacterized protein N7496_006936 [Penicillium cataractarum]|uniref:DH domain-containing protein n=1 Tax=Penicillium cataractarum TaxID=2100454 RepID=A0A9W9S4F8_9EURO|nr:uncharacterized protein N7496_006936 [Penicillium cataractarum]KAJ5370844.1 hypothetical protein N7496_006936 [Penicillium cataractarum]